MFAAYDVSSRQSYITRTNLIPTSWLVINSNKLKDRKSELYVLIALVSQSVSQSVSSYEIIILLAVGLTGLVKTYFVAYIIIETSTALYIAL